MKATVVSKMRHSPDRKKIAGYVLNWVRNPDRRSAFYREVRLIKWLPGPFLITLLKTLKYDGLVFQKNGKIVSNVFFQRHGNALHTFAIAVVPEFQHKGFAKESVRQFIAYSKTVPGITKVRIGAGGDPAIKAVFECLRKEEAQLGIKVQKDGWVELLK